MQLRQKLEWHVHEVSALKIEQSYLYSGGEEGVVVLWHLRENKRDFLPRLGAQIVNIKIVESKIYCMLADNTIKSIDLNNDKALLHYKTIVSPTLRWIAPSAAAKTNTNLVRVSQMQDQIYLRSQPGKIQNIHLGNGVNSEFSIVGRNATSRLDSNLPNPHQLTDVYVLLCRLLFREMAARWQQQYKEPTAAVSSSTSKIKAPSNCCLK